MDEDLLSYIPHYLMTIDSALYLLLTLVGLNVVLTVMRLTVKDREEFELRVESLFELIFCGGAILGFMAVYYLINRFCVDEVFLDFWNEYNDYLLLFMIIIFILLNRLVDNVLIRLQISHEDKTAVRLVSMIYMLIIFFYIKFIYENNNYDMFITYFLCLLVGRFVYFDVSFGDFTASMKAAFRKFPILLIALIYLSAMCFIGFKSGYLVKHIGVITNVFYTHLCMTVSIALVFYVYKIWKGIRGISGRKKADSANQDTEEPAAKTPEAS